MAWTPFTRANHDRSALRYTSDVTDKEFARISPLLPAQARRGRKRRTDLGSVIDAICYVLQSGCAWANSAKDFPPKSTVYGYFRRFLEDGTWARIHDALYVETRDLDGREAQPSAAIIDSQSVRAGGNAKGDVGYDAGQKVRGRKRHIDTLGLLLRPDVHSAGMQDRDGALRLLEKMICSVGELDRFFVRTRQSALNVDYPGLCEVARLIVDTRPACARPGIVSDTVVKA